MEYHLFPNIFENRGPFWPWGQLLLSRKCIFDRDPHKINFVIKVCKSIRTALNILQKKGKGKGKIGKRHKMFYPLKIIHWSIKSCEYFLGLLKMANFSFLCWHTPQLSAAFLLANCDVFPLNMESKKKWKCSSLLWMKRKEKIGPFWHKLCKFIKHK